MKTSISLKQLRTDPREYVRLLKDGYEVDITEHRKTIVKAVQAGKLKRAPGNAATILQVIKDLPPMSSPYPDMDTVELVKKARLEGLEQKYRERT